MPHPLQSYYLQQMGIESWQLRKPVEPPPKTLKHLAVEVAACQRCPLHQSRCQTVFARGNPHAKIMIVGEAPGFHEDQQGLPFVGKAGALLDKMLQAVQLTPEDVYIVNVLKCRPPENRDPNPEEIEQCSEYLIQQIDLVAPTVLFAVGRFAGQFLFEQPLTLSNMRNKTHTYRGIPLIVSYHPAYLLRNPRDKKKALDDLIRLKGLSCTDVLHLL